MAFAIRSTDHTGITVRDLDRSVAFWHDVLGFEIERRAHLTGSFAADVTGVPGADISTAIVAAPGHRIELLQYNLTGTARPGPQPDVPGSMHLAFTVDDLDDLPGPARRSGPAATAPGTRPSSSACRCSRRCGGSG